MNDKEKLALTGTIATLAACIGFGFYSYRKAMYPGVQARTDSGLTIRHSSPRIVGETADGSNRVRIELWTPVSQVTAQTCEEIGQEHKTYAGHTGNLSLGYHIGGGTANDWQPLCVLSFQGRDRDNGGYLTDFSEYRGLTIHTFDEVEKVWQN